MAPSRRAETPIERHVWVVAGVVILGMIMSILDTTIVNVALATLARDLHSGVAAVQWVITGYMLALGATIPLTGWAARRFGAKPTYMVSLVLFTVGSAACGLSSAIGPLIAFRVLQGVGGGMLMPVAMIIMAEVAGPQRMGRVMGVVSMPAMIAPILGPVLGGVIVQSLHWSWIFFVNVPVGVLALAMAARMLPHTDSGEAGPLDLRGLLLLSSGLVGFTFGISELGAGAPIGSLKVLLGGLLGLALMGAFLASSSRAARPLLDLRLYRSRIYSGAAFTTLGASAALFGAMILIPLYYQVVRGDSVIAAGLLTVPQGLGALVAMPLAGRISERLGGGRVAVAGVLLLSISTVPLAFLGARTSLVYISAILLVRGLSIGLCFMPAMTAAFAALRPEQVSDASPQLNVLQRIGGAVGTAIVAAVLAGASRQARTPAALAHAYDKTYWVALAIAALSLLPALLLLRAERADVRERSAGEQHPQAALEGAGL
ncbi:MAG TPA: MDR family MFS transporter [Solirubrobacteraceae bacterium]|nr:MDR family MFS transporter [Solirubrobacteraceae bacterium]